MSTIELRPYQQDVIAECREKLRGGVSNICLVAPTGAGKTVIAAEIIRRTTENSKRVLVLAHTREIIKQTSAKLTTAGITHGVIMGADTVRTDEPVQVASVQTYWSRVIRTKRMTPPAADLIVVDECHHIRAKTWRWIIESYPGVPLIGLTATPCRSDGRGLGSSFDVLVECPQVADLITLKFLVPTRTYAPPELDLQGVRTQTCDYVVSDLAARVDTDPLVGDIITHWLKHAAGLKTIVFAVNVAHSRHITDEFNKAGTKAEHIDGGTPKTERDAILARLAAGTTQVVSNCKVLTEGFNLPDIGCLVLARPTRQQGLYRQMVGRGLRPAPDKCSITQAPSTGTAASKTRSNGRSSRICQRQGQRGRCVSRREKDKGRLSPFVPYLKETMQQPAWRTMSLGARMLYLHLKAHYNVQSHNNGRIYLATRTAAKELGSGLSQVGRWFRELHHYGFIVMMKAGSLGVDGKGTAPKWRLTELGYMKDPPTRDYTRWDGVLFDDAPPKESRARKQIPDPENGIRVIQKAGSVVIQKTGSLPAPSDPESGIKGNGLSDPESGIKSSITTRVVRAGSKKGAEPSLRVVLPKWSEPQLIELPWSEYWQRFYCEVVDETAGKEVA
jgi:superfamily II DNA or RNA helicase